MNELFGYFEQSNISKKNLKRLKELSVSEIPKVKVLADVIFKIAQIHPSRRKRIGFIRHNYPEMWVKLMEVGLIPYEGFFEGDDEQDDISIKILNFENLCEYEEFEDFDNIENEFENENIGDNECPF